MLTMNSLFGRRLALECRYDGPMPRRFPAGVATSQAVVPAPGPTVRAIARRRRGLGAAAAEGDAALLRMTRYLTQAVVSRRKGLRPAP